MLGVVVVTYNSARYVQKCLDSLVREIERSQVCVVDNASEDETRKAVSDYRDIFLLKNEKNIGFSRAVNMGVQHWLTQGAEKILVLNADTALERGSIEEMEATLDRHPKAMIVQPLLTLMKSPQKVNTWGNVHKGFGLVSLGGYRQSIPTDLRDRPIEFASGACMLIRSKAFKKFGYFDEQYFLYFEDSEFSQRVRRGGGEIWLSARARVQHDHAFPLSPQKALHFIRSWRRFSSTFSDVLS